MSDNITSFAPPGESASDIWSEVSNFNGAILAAWFHGILFLVFFLTMRELLKPAMRHIRWSLVAYSFVMFSLATIAFGTDIVVTQDMFINDRNAPGGPNGALGFLFSSTVGIVSNIAFIVANTMADGLLLYRCFVIWDRRYWVLLLPGLLYLATFSIGVVLAVQFARPDETIWGSVNIGLTYFGMTISLNVLVTMFIAGRLLYHRANHMKTLGKQHTGHYLSITAMLVESAGLNVIFSLLFIVPFAMGNNVANLWLTVLGLVQIMSPLLVIGRVASGQAFQGRSSLPYASGGGASASIPLGPVKFNPNSRNRSGSGTLISSQLESGNGPKVTIQSQTEVDYSVDYKRGSPY